MKTEFIPYEQALELKELGFEEECWMFWCKDGNKPFLIYTKVPAYQSYLPSPLYQQAFKWFRDKYNLVITIIPIYNYEYFTYYYKCYDGISKKSYEDSRLFRTYEEAEFECLKNLIQIAKN